MILARYSSYRKIGAARNFWRSDAGLPCCRSKAGATCTQAIFPTPWPRLGYTIGTFVDEIEIIMRNALSAWLSNLKETTVSLSVAIMRSSMPTETE
jgi:hypothetical protein